MNFAEQLRQAEANAANNLQQTDLLPFHFTDAVRSAATRNMTLHRVTGYYYMESGYDHDDYGFTEQASFPAAHITDGTLVKADPALVQQQVTAKLTQMGFQVGAVRAEKRSKTVPVENGYGLFGKQKYKDTPVEYLLLYIDIRW